MKNELALIIPAAGRGSRFTSLGVQFPKPLIDLHGKPFFWWAVESVRRVVPLRQLVFVVLQEHVKNFAIGDRIKNYYPDATIVSVPEVTDGAAETARLGLDALKEPGVVAFNDCDHAFHCPSLAQALGDLQAGVDGLLMCFRSTNPAYSYVRLGTAHEILGTIEKQVASPYAIAGCYIFADSAKFTELYAQYKSQCVYKELFLSGVFNQITQAAGRVGMIELESHCSFGTPEELALVSRKKFMPFLAWVDT